MPPLRPNARCGATRLLQSKPAQQEPRMNTTTGLQAEDFDTLDQILDDMRERFEETPQWDFCEGFMAAMVCCRRPLTEEEWLPMLLGVDPDDAEGGSFADDAQRQQALPPRYRPPFHPPCRRLRPRRRPGARPRSP